MPAELDAPPAPAKTVVPPAPAARPAPAAAALVRWRAASPRRLNHRGRRLLFGSLLLSLFVSGFIWLGSLFAPPSGVEFVMIGAGYEENLAVPHNVFGWNTLADLSVAVDHGSKESIWSKRFWRASPQPQRLTVDSDFAKLIPQSPARQMVIYLAAHGAVDVDGAYLVADDDQTPILPDHRLRLTKLLDRLEALPPQQHKVLVLDVVMQPSDVTRGMLANSFTFEVSKLESRIEKIPNLVVICSSGPDELAWPCPEWTRTVFGHFWIEGLRGAANDGNDDGRINLAELIAFTGKQTEHWVERRFGVQQSPWMLPRGEEGQRRAARMDVAWKEGPYQAEAPARDLPAAIPASVRDAWDQAAEMNSHGAPPYIYQSQTWRRYIAALSRYEQLILAGDNASAQRLMAQVQVLAASCKHDPTQLLSSLESHRSSVVYHDARTAEMRGQAQDLLQQFAQTPQSQWPDIWKKTFAAAGKTGQALRGETLQLLLEQASGDPTRRLTPMRQLVDIIRDPAQPLCPVMQLAVMLERDLPAESRTLAGAPLISQAIRVRHLAEYATTGSAQGFIPSSPRVRAWVAERVAAADALRQEGEDLVMAGPAQASEAKKRLDQAETMYRAAIADGQAVLAAYSARDRAFALLPDLSMSLVSAPRVASKRSVELALLEGRIELAWKDVHALTRDLATPHELTEASLNDLKQHTQSVEGILAAVFQQVRTLWKELATDRHSLASLRLPHMPLPTKEDVDLRCEVTNQTLQSLREQRESLRQVLAMAASGHDSQDSEEPAEPISVQTLAGIRARLAVAMLGENRFTELAKSGDDTWAEMQHRLEIVRVDSDWRAALVALGNQLAIRWQRMPGEIDDLLDKCNQDGLPNAMCIEADNLARQMPVQWAARLDDKASDALRRRRLSAFLAWQAQRAWDDHWSGENGEMSPYYAARARALLADAERVWPAAKAFEQLSQRWSAEKDWQLATPKRIALTPELPLATACQIIPDSDALHGFVNIRVRSGNGIASSSVQGAPFAWPEQPGIVPFAISTSIDPQHVDTGLASSSVSVEAYFRGRRITKEIAADLHGLPEHLQRQSPAPREGMIAIETSPDLLNQLASGSGAVAIVLDASGSMGSKAGQPFDAKTRYAQATQALTAVLGSIPRGTQLSVWTFGQAVGPAKTVKDAEKTVVCLRPLSPWEPNDKAAHDQLLQGLSYPHTEPWNESAVVHAMLVAKKDLVSAPGSRTLIAITDGVDNRFINDKEANPQGLDVAGGLAENFRNAGIALNIVGFQIAGHEEQAARAQFAIIESFTPPGRFYSVSETSELIAALEASLDRQLRYWIEDFDRRSVLAADTSGWSPTTAVPLPRDRSSAPRGDYRLRVVAGNVLELPAVVNGGDLLLASLGSNGEQAAIGRASVLARLYPQMPQTSCGDWNAGVLKSALASDGALVQVALERQVNPRELQLAMPAPVWSWWECSVAGQPATSVGVERSYEVGTPAWNIRSQTSAALSTQVRGAVNGWWLDDTSALQKTSLLPGRDFDQLPALEGHTISVAGQSVEVRAARWEEINKQRQLLLVIDGPPDLQIHAQLKGVGEVGSEERHYVSLGRYVGRFVIGDGAIKEHAWLELTSIAAMKQLAEAQGTSLHRDDLILQRAAKP